MTTDFRLISHAAQAMRTYLRPVALAIDCPSEVLPTPGWAHQAQDRGLQFVDALLHREVFQDAVLDLVQPVVVFIQNRSALPDCA
jgi:hypothetical protein